jgi:hypothetical protein
LEETSKTLTKYKVALNRWETLLPLPLEQPKLQPEIEKLIEPFLDRILVAVRGPGSQQKPAEPAPAIAALDDLVDKLQETHREELDLIENDEEAKKKLADFVNRIPTPSYEMAERKIRQLLKPEESPELKAYWAAGKKKKKRKQKNAWDIPKKWEPGEIPFDEVAGESEEPEPTDDE